MSKKSLYILILVLSLVSYVWLFLSFSNQSNAKSLPTICAFKQVSTIPCPACGTTRSVLAILQGGIAEAVMINPLGLLAFLLLIIIPCWIVIDLIRNRSDFYLFYKKAECFVQNKYIASVFIIVILANWVWNIMKEL